MSLFFRQRDDAVGDRPHPWGYTSVRYYATTLAGLRSLVSNSLYRKIKIIKLNNKTCTTLFLENKGTDLRFLKNNILGLI